MNESKRRLKIGFPISTFVLGDGLPGIDKYTYKLIEALLKRQEVDVLVFQEKYRNNGPFDRFEICYFPILKEIFGLRPRSAPVDAGGPETGGKKRGGRGSTFRALRRDIIKSFYYLSKGVDVIHYPTHMESPLSLTFSRTVLTFHDVVPRVLPETSTAEIIERFDRCVSRLRYVDTILTVSNFSKREMVEKLGIDPEKITVCYNGVDDIFFIEESSGDIVRKYSGGSPYILFVGTLEPRKNVESLLEAFRELNRREMKLLLAGKEGWGTESIRKKIQELALGQDVSFLGYVPEEDLPHLYRGAEAFVYPSYYEGFGIPIIEAMASGAPVITSRAASLTETAGDAAILVTPGDVHGIVEALRGILDNPTLKGELRAKGIERAKVFSWDRCADQVLSVYRGNH